MFKYILFLFSALVILSGNAEAAQSYNVTFVNNSSANIYINSSAGSCFSIWKMPGDWTMIEKGKSSGIFTIKDKNSGNCINSTKIAAWIASDKLNGNNLIQVKMTHTRPNSHSWPTELSGSTNAALPFELSGGTCEAKAGVLPCFNTEVLDVKNPGGIVFIFSDSSHF